MHGRAGSGASDQAQRPERLMFCCSSSNGSQPPEPHRSSNWRRRPIPKRSKNTWKGHRRSGTRKRLSSTGWAFAARNWLWRQARGRFAPSSEYRVLSGPAYGVKKPAFHGAQGDSQGGHPLESYFSLLNFLFVEKKKFRPRMHGRAGSGASDQAQRPARLRPERHCLT